MKKKYIILILILISAPSRAHSATPTTEEVIVIGKREAATARNITTIDSAQIENSQQPALLPLLTEAVPGLFTTSKGLMGYGVASGAAGGITVRGIGGSPTTGLLVLIDGHPQYMGLMGHPISDAYQTMHAQQVEVLRGAASALYGSNAMGGVINIITKKMAEDGTNTALKIGGGSYNTITTELNNMTRAGRFSSVVAASYNRTDGHRADIGFEQYGGYAKVGYNLNYAWNVSGDVNITHFNASNPGPTNAPIIDNDARVTRGVAAITIDNGYKKTDGSLKLYYNWGDHKINNGYTAPAEPLPWRFHSDDIMLGAAAWQNVTLPKLISKEAAPGRLTFGADWAHYGGRAYNHYITDGSDIEMVNTKQNELAAYVNAQQPLTPRITANAAIRAHTLKDAGKAAGRAEWIPQAGITAELPYNTALKLAASKGYRNPTIRELYMFDVSNPELTPERLWSYELSLTHWGLGGQLRYGMNLFYITGDNMIQIQNISGRPQNTNTGEVQNWGIEAEGSYRISREWSVAAHYSWLAMKYPVIAAPEHRAYVGISYAKRKIRLSSSLQYVAALYTSITPAEQESFALLSFMGSYQLTPLFEVYIRGENLLGQAYTINYGYPMPGATVFGGFNLRIKD